MNKQLNARVRQYFLEYVDLYNVHLKRVSKEIGIDYTNLMSFKNDSRQLGEVSLKKIVRHIENVERKQEALSKIIVNLKDVV